MLLRHIKAHSARHYHSQPENPLPSTCLKSVNGNWRETSATKTRQIPAAQLIGHDLCEIMIFLIIINQSID
jgi:hypothetical protein